VIFEPLTRILALRYMEVYSFRTVLQPADSIYKEKGSRFLAFVFPVANEAEVKAAIESLKKKYFDARHHCFAWMLGAEKKQFRAFDDGEPNHSAGDPILGQIRSRDLTDVLVVVVRYFGGTKLGVGGLISAYKTAASEALDKAGNIERDVVAILDIKYDYDATPEVMKAVKDFDLKIVNQDFGDRCSLELEVSLRNKSFLLEKLRLMRSMGTSIDVND
jgi:uncharacterized YigZ family protein